jgi:cell division septal protein FtsQ
MPVAAPSDKRFRRAHVPPARRTSWRPSRRAVLSVLILCAVSGYAVYRAMHLMMAAEALTITRITVSGHERMSRGEVLALLADLPGANMLSVDLDAWRRTLLDSPWVADAAMRRVFPGTVAVTISERTPLGIGRIGDGLFLIDHRGTIIDEFGPSYAGFDLPIIDGLAAASAGGGTLVDEGRAALAGRLLADLQRRPDLAKQISQIDVSDIRDAAVILEGDPALVRVGDGHFVERVQSYLDLAPALRERVPEIDYVDLRFDERVYVRPVNAGRLPASGARP